MCKYAHVQSTFPGEPGPLIFLLHLLQDCTSSGMVETPEILQDLTNQIKNRICYHGFLNFFFLPLLQMMA